MSLRARNAYICIYIWIYIYAGTNSLEIRFLSAGNQKRHAKLCRKFILFWYSGHYLVSGPCEPCTECSTFRYHDLAEKVSYRFDLAKSITRRWLWDTVNNFTVCSGDVRFRMILNNTLITALTIIPFRSSRIHCAHACKYIRGSHFPSNRSVSRLLLQVSS